MKLILVLVVFAAGLFGLYHVAAVNHIGAPPDPYGPCNKGSYYRSFWEKDSAWSGISKIPGSSPPPPQGGVVHYLGYTEVASCVASLTAKAG